MKKVILLQLILLFCTCLFAKEPGGESVFNPEDKWIYRISHLPNSEYSDWLNSVYDVHQYEMRVDGEVELDGKKYFRLAWTPKAQIEGEKVQYFYLREENGAFYSYIIVPDYVSNPMVETGEYLIYDFNMKKGDKYKAPYRSFLYEEEILYGVSYKLGEMIVTDTAIDDRGRRVVELMCLPDNTYPHLRQYTVTIVEGLGPLSPGNVATLMFSEELPMSANPTDMVLESVINQYGEEIYLDHLDIKAGLCAERDYTWIYAIFDKDGNTSYSKMGFNYVREYVPNTNKIYRRFGTLGVSDNLEEDWRKAHFNRYLVREENGKIWLYHSENILHYDYENIDGDCPSLESLIYDFGASDGEELTFYSPEGVKGAKISTGFTLVGGEDKLSYTFEGSDGVRCVESIGITKGGILPAVNTEFHRPVSDDDESFVGAVLVAVYDGEGNLLFRQDLPDAVDAISASEGGFIAPAARLYDLQGRELREAVPGQPYIKGGKVFVEAR